MDFHSLARRELQILCKQNKIPANITNIAMADALTALHIVQGIEEFLKPTESETAQSSVESPEKTSPIPPHTGYGTSNRRKKTVKDEPETFFTTSRRVTRRTFAAEVDETKNGVPETPTVPKRAPAASARWKMESQLKQCEEDQKIGDLMVQEKKIGTDLKEKTSVRRVYSTRHSVRLSEKKISEPNTKNTEAVKIGSFCKEVSVDLVAKTNEGMDDVSEDMCISGVELLKISEEGSEKNTNDLLQEVQNLNAASENKRDSDEDDEEDKKGDSHQAGDSKATEEVFDEMNIVSDEDEYVNTSVAEKSINVQNEAHDLGAERSDESDIIILGENVDNALDINDDVLEQSGSDDCEVHKQLLSNTENPNELSKLENDMVLEDSAAAMFSFDEIDSINPQSSVKVVNELANLSASAAAAADDEDQNQDTELELPFQDDDDDDDDDDADIETDTELYEIEVLESKLAAAHSVLPESGIQECKESESSDDQHIMDSNNATEVLLFEINIQAVADSDFSQVVAEEPAMMETHTSHPVLDKTPPSDMASDQSKDQTPVIEKRSEAWVGVYGSAANEFKMATHELSLPLEITTASSVKRSPLLVPKASMTPGKKLLSKTPTKIQEIMSLVSDDKENIDNSGIKLDLTRENGKKKKKTAEDKLQISLTDASLRQLTKMLKEKLQISNNNMNTNIDEEKNTAKVERARPALQRLPENRLAMGGP